MYSLTEKRLADFFKHQPETGMGYWIATVVLKDGRQYRQVIINSGILTKVKGHQEIPFIETDIDHFIVTHEKWDFLT